MTGVEPATFSLGSCTPPVVGADGAETCASGPDDPRRSPSNAGGIDPRLAAIAGAWGDLPEAMRAALAEAAQAWRNLDDRQRAELIALAEAARVMAGRG